MMLLAMTMGASYGLYLSMALAVAGLVCTSRLIASDHTQKEIYAGLVAGIGCMLLSIWFN
jgi:hypothetical protein